jgi:GDPmannose 4,6-dehydratase
MKRALITGICGQDGAYLAKLLLGKSYAIYGLVRRVDDNVEARARLVTLGIARKIVFVEGDLREPSTLVAALQKAQPDEVYNLAGQSSVRHAWEKPTETALINGVGVCNLLEAMRKYAPQARLFQASSAEMFGVTSSGSTSEEQCLRPRSPYGASKAYAHQMVTSYRSAHGMHASCGILFNHESPLRGLEFVTRKITRAVAQIKLGKAKDLQLGNVDARRDWGHAQDYVRAMWLMLQQESADDYVLATGISHSVREFAETAFSYVGLNAADYLRFEKSLERPSDIPVLTGNSKKAQERLGWKLDYSFAEMVREMVAADLENPIN